ncbi:hypothetical protein TNCT_384421 [Trichonephila clavata]|uniref:DUF19 domain-containing protein n=1 Tax=Trichonephila clavata TaxID=2740835 RepID=A0A8X6LMT8_TRICU|nr:hypothetical protein TNCT_384421 [Trichonephila clavata]
MWLYLLGFLCIMRGLLTSETQSNDARHNPKSHICVSKILECDPYRVQLSPGKEIGAPMFTELNDLRKACKYANRFLLCLKIASEHCKRFPFLLGNKMILSRSFPQELCRYNSFWEKWYIKKSSCVNEFSDGIEDMCAMNIMQYLITRYEDTVEINCR